MSDVRWLRSGHSELTWRWTPVCGWSYIVDHFVFTSWCKHKHKSSATILILFTSFTGLYHSEWFLLLYKIYRHILDKSLMLFISQWQIILFYQDVFWWLIPKPSYSYLQILLIVLINFVFNRLFNKYEIISITQFWKIKLEYIDIVVLRNKTIGIIHIFIVLFCECNTCLLGHTRAQIYSIFFNLEYKKQ